MATNVRAPLPARWRRGEALRSTTARADPAALTELFRCHYQELYRYCRSIVHHDEDARDALQSALTKAWSALEREERDFEVRPWLFRIAHNEAVSVLRARRWSQQRELVTTPEMGEDSLARTVEDRARLRQLQDDLADLPERQRSALVLRELSGLGHEEIAKVIGGTTGAAKQTIFEARRALLDCAEGRDMGCEEVQRTLSDGDGRVVGSRRIRGHLRTCAVCSAFGAAIDRRSADLAVLCPPMPAVVGAALLAKGLAAAGSGALPGAAGQTGAAGLGAGAAGSASSAGSAAVGLASGVAAKAAAVIVVAAAVGGTVAVGGLPHHDRPGAEHVRSAPAGVLPRPGRVVVDPSTVRVGAARRATGLDVHGASRLGSPQRGADPTAAASSHGNVGTPSASAAEAAGDSGVRARGVPSTGGGTRGASGKPAEAHGRPGTARAPAVSRRSSPAPATKPKHAPSPSRRPKVVPKHGGGTSPASPPPPGARRRGSGRREGAALRSRGILRRSPLTSAAPVR